MEKSVAERAIEDAQKDRTLADELRDEADIAKMHSLCQRLITEREVIGKAFAAMVQGWSMLSSEGPTSSSDSVAAIERVAHEAIEFAREVVKAITQK